MNEEKTIKELYLKNRSRDSEMFSEYYDYDFISIAIRDQWTYRKIQKNLNRDEAIQLRNFLNEFIEANNEK